MAAARLTLLRAVSARERLSDLHVAVAIEALDV